MNRDIGINEIMSTMDQSIKDDPGIDFENYSLEEEKAKYAGAHPAGYRILLRIYVPPPAIKTVGGIILPESVKGKEHQDAKFSNLVGLVVKFGRGVYKDEERYKHTGSLCKIGDWVQFERASGYTFAHNKLTSIYIYEDHVAGIIDDPRTITRISTNNY